MHDPDAESSLSEFELEDIVDAFSGDSFRNNFCNEHFGEPKPLTLRGEGDHVPPSSIGLSEERVDEKQCWGGLLLGDGADCTPNFVSTKGHFKNKLCPNCQRDGICIPASRMCSLSSEAVAAVQNRSETGVWNTANRFAELSDSFRIINHTARCVGHKLMILRGQAPEGSMPVPAPWIKDGRVHLILSKGTLVPALAARPILQDVVFSAK